MQLFDCHFHVIDHRFPLVPNAGYLPDEFTVADYLRTARPLGVAAGTVVSGSFQAFDQTYLVAALQELGPGFVGVSQVPASAPDEELLKLNAAGVKAVRFNLKRGGSACVQEIELLSRRAYEVAGWHSEFYVDSADLLELYPKLKSLPAICIDHLGLSQVGFNTLLELVSQGAHVKATGFGRVDMDVASALKSIMAANPDSLMFGTDLPSTRAPRPFRASDVDLIRTTFDEKLAEKILFSNAVAFYGVRYRQQAVPG